MQWLLSKPETLSWYRLTNYSSDNILEKKLRISSDQFDFLFFDSWTSFSHFSYSLLNHLLLITQGYKFTRTFENLNSIVNETISYYFYCSDVLNITKLIKQVYFDEYHFKWQIK